MTTPTDPAALVARAANECTCAYNVDEERTVHGSTGTFSRCLTCRLAAALEAALAREAEKDRVAQDMAMLIRQLMRHVDARQQEIADFLTRVGYAGSPLRAARAALEPRND